MAILSRRISHFATEEAKKHAFVMETRCAKKQPPSQKLYTLRNGAVQKENLSANLGRAVGNFIYPGEFPKFDFIWRWRFLDALNICAVDVLAGMDGAFTS